MGASDEPSDDDLMARIADGDRDAFALLYRRFRADVFRFALHVSGSSSVADDVAQDVFMAVIHEASRYQPGRSSVRAWLFGIARNQVRRSRGRPADTSLDGEAASAVAFAVNADPLPDIVRRQDIATLRRAILALPVKFREAVVLCDLEELSYADAAAALRCAVGTVRSRLHRGRRLLAKRLRADGAPAFHPRMPRWIV